MAPKFFDASGDAYLLNLTMKVRAFRFVAARAWMEPHYQAIVPVECLERKGRGWNARCNDATVHHLKQLIAAEKVSLLKDRDCGNVPLFTAAEVFDSDRLNDSSITELTTGFTLDLCNLQRSFEFYSTAAHTKLLEDVHEKTASEFPSSQSALTSYLIALRNEGFQQEFDTWTLLPIPTSIDEYWDKYAGDATFKSGGETVIVCAPWINRFWVDSVVKEFLQKLIRRLRGKRFKLVSSCGFRFYRKKFHRMPWEA